MTNATRRRTKIRWPDWLDTFAFAAWGILFLRYWLTGRLGLLIHPNYFALSIAAGLTLLGISGLSAWRLLKGYPGPSVQHVTLFPPKTMAFALLLAAVVGLVVTPRPFASQTAIQRGLQDSNIVTRVKPQSFSTGKSSEKRTLIDWIRTLEVYPEPDAYLGQKVSIQGFSVHSEELGQNYLILTRFVITCCAADVYPIGLPIKLPRDRSNFPQDQWFKVQGEMITESMEDERKLVVQADTLTPISEPQNPYEY